MMRAIRGVVPVLAVMGILWAAASADAQEAGDCPPAEAEVGVPIEIRFGDLLLRARVASGETETGDGTRVEGRLIGCERDRAEEDAAAGLQPVLRLLHDLRVGLELAPVGDDGRCLRAGIDVMDAASEFPGTAADGPVAVELCLPFRLDRPAPASSETDG